MGGRGGWLLRASVYLLSEKLALVRENGSRWLCILGRGTILCIIYGSLESDYMLTEIFG